MLYQILDIFTQKTELYYNLKYVDYEGESEFYPPL